MPLQRLVSWYRLLGNIIVSKTLLRLNLIISNAHRQDKPVKTILVLFLMQEMKSDETPEGWSNESALSAGAGTGDTPTVMANGGSLLRAHHNELLASQEAQLTPSGIADDIRIELSHYLKRPNVPSDRYPLAEWSQMKAVFPNIYPVAMKNISMLATSVPSERLFSQSGQIVTKQRNRLSGKHVNQLLFLSSVDEELWGR